MTSESIISEYSFPACTLHKKWYCSKCGGWGVSKPQHKCELGFTIFKGDKSGIVFDTDVQRELMYATATVPIGEYEDAFVFVRAKLIGPPGKAKAYLYDPNKKSMTIINKHNLVIVTERAAVYVNDDYTPALISIATIEQIMTLYELPVRRFNRLYDNQREANIHY